MIQTVHAGNDRQMRRYARRNRIHALGTPHPLSFKAWKAAHRLLRFPVVLIEPELRVRVFRACGEHYDEDAVLACAEPRATAADLRTRGFIKAGRVWYGPGCVIEDYGVVSRRVITTVGVNYTVDAHQNTTELENFNFHAMGVGATDGNTNDATAEAVGDTALNTEVETRATGTQSEPAANQYRTVGTITATAARNVEEHGLLSASSAGTLYDRSKFTNIALAIADSIQFTHTTTYTAGG